jgi:hypothetical protein
VALFPFAMLATLLTGHVGTPAVIAFGVLQYPIYGVVTAFTKASNRMRVIVALGAAHIVVATVAFAFSRNGMFIRKGLSRRGCGSTATPPDVGAAPGFDPLVPAF